MKKRSIRGVCLLLILCMTVACFGCSRQGKAQRDRVESNIEDDGQPYWNTVNHNFAKANGGYYYLTSKDRIKKINFFDPETQSSILVCGKADCTHNDLDCNACLDGTIFVPSSLYFYSGMLYLIKYQKDQGLYVLVSISPDGSNRKELFEIGKGTSNGGLLNLVFLNDSVYIYSKHGNIGSSSDKSLTNIRRRSLDGKEDEYIYSFKGEKAGDYAIIASVKAYSGKLYFCVESRTNKEENRVDVESLGILEYDPSSKSTKTVLNKNVLDYSIDTTNNEIYYYVMNDGLYRADFGGGNAKKLYSCDKTNIYSKISFDGTYLYVSNNTSASIGLNYRPYVWILDLEGNELNKIETRDIYFGDKDYIFSETPTNGLGYIKKSEITTATGWTAMP